MPLERAALRLSVRHVPMVEPRLDTAAGRSAAAEAERVEQLEPLELFDGHLGTPALRIVSPLRAGRSASGARSPETDALYARARSLWPGLDARALSRCNGDPRRVARLVMRRTILTEEAIVQLLMLRR